MKYIFISIFFCLVLTIGTNWNFLGTSFAESDIEVIGTNAPEYEEDEPITQEMIDKEEEWLDQKVREINEAPLEEFGSIIMKRKKRAYYLHRLKLLRDSPEKYFKTKTDE